MGQKTYIISVPRQQELPQTWTQVVAIRLKIVLQGASVAPVVYI